MEIWMAHCIFVSGTALCASHDPHHEDAPLRHASEYLFCRVGVGWFNKCIV